MFAIRHKPTRKFLGVYVSSNYGAYNWNDCSVTLDIDMDNIWVAPTFEIAANALFYEVKWYNSGMAHPMLSVKIAEQCEIVYLTEQSIVMSRDEVRNRIKGQK